MFQIAFASLLFNAFKLTLVFVSHYKHISDTDTWRKIKKMPLFRRLTRFWKDFTQLFIQNMSLFCLPRGIMNPHSQFKRGTSAA